MTTDARSRSLGALVQARNIDVPARVVPGSSDIKIRTEELTFHYGGFLALKSISLQVPEKQITAIIGPSGCGKSTFLRTLNRMQDLVPGVRIQGSVYLNGEDIYAPDVDPTAVRTHVGMVFQRPNPFPKTIYENVAFGPRMHGRRSRQELDGVVGESLRQAAFWEGGGGRLNGSASALSAGHHQRLCIARALAMQPDVLLMDEPPSALDPIATLRIEELM